MLHIFVNPEDIQGDLLHVTGPEVNHIKNVLRMKPGEEVSVSNGVDDKDYRYGIEELYDDEILMRLRFVKDANVELPSKVYLFQGLPKSDKMDFIVQKAVELGAAVVVPVAMERSIMKLDPKKAEKKVQRWQTIAQSAASQSKRKIIPEVMAPMTMKQAIQFAKDNTQVRVLPYELQEDDGSTKALLESIEPGQAVSIFIGPEGGFEPWEVDLAKEAGIKPISLGKRILRTETAGLTILSWLIYTMEIS